MLHSLRMKWKTIICFIFHGRYWQDTSYAVYLKKVHCHKCDRTWVDYI